MPPTTVTLPEPLVVLHVPPDTASLNDVVDNWHTPVFPNIAVGVAITVTIAVV